MKTPTLITLATIAAVLPGIAGEMQFVGDPPDATHPWAKQDMNRPQPPIVTPAAKLGDPPSDAIVLFDGTKKSFEDNWEPVHKDRKVKWTCQDGEMTSHRGAGFIRTKAEFGDCQLHIEWKSPTPPTGEGQARGNSGVFLMGKAEVQVLDNYKNPTYADGTAGALYGVMPPMVNALRKSGQWDSYDIIFRRPITKNGKIVDQGSMTVFCNGVLVQDHTPLEGGGGWVKRTHPIPYPEAGSFPDKGPLELQDHGSAVSFRNIWYRKIRLRPVEGGTDGQLSPAVTKAKRAEIAADILKDAQTKTGDEKMLRLLESLKYQPNDKVLKQVMVMGDAYLKELKGLSSKALVARKREVVENYRAFKYMTHFHLIPDNTSVYKGLDQIMDAQNWKRGK